MLARQTRICPIRSQSDTPEDWSYDQLGTCPQGCQILADVDMSGLHCINLEGKLLGYSNLSIEIR